METKIYKFKAGSKKFRLKLSLGSISNKFGAIDSRDVSLIVKNNI